MGKLDYFLQSAWKSLVGPRPTCPSCGAGNGIRVDRKWIVTSLLRCPACRLLYRTPTTDTTENAKFYQSKYQQGFTTDLPDDATLAQLKNGGFAGTEKDFGRCIAFLEALGAQHGVRLLDFGCSWGYGSYQLAQAGYVVEAFEISEPRGTYAREKFGLTVYHDVKKLINRTYDVFFSSHVIEHVPSVRDMLAIAERVLVPGGLFLALTPNGCDAYRQVDAAGWHRLWGQVHPQLLDDEFIRHALPNRGWLMTSTPLSLETLREHQFNQPLTGSLKGSELLIAYRTNP